ncbi:hypothetical protein, partial [Glaesserella parasuis]|uniref:hypothetical protein n=1 Tax=Glaesserella parasuis TaxID=738 RepID=UPI001BE40E66
FIYIFRVYRCPHSIVKKKKKKQHLHKIKNKIDAGSILEVVSKSAAPLPEITASCGATKEAC